MTTPENRLKAWQIVERNLDPDSPHTKLAESIARAIENAQEEGFRSAFQPMQQVEFTRPTVRQHPWLPAFILIVMVVGFALVVAFGPR